MANFIQFLNGFRKFTVMVTIVAAGVVFRVLNYVNGAEFVDLLKGTAIAFFASNAGEHMTKAIGEWLQNKVNNDK